MSGTTEGYALSIAELGQTVPMTMPDAETARRLRASLKGAGADKVSVRLAEDESDVEGHTLAGALRSVAVRVHLDPNDTEGHAISVHFPNAEEAARFRNRLIASGILAGSIVFASAAAVGITSAPAGTQVAAPQTPVVEVQRPADRGMIEGATLAPAAAAPAAGSAAVPVTGIDPAPGLPVERELIQGAEIGMGAAAPAASQATGIDPATGRPARSGLVEGASIGGAGQAAPAAGSQVQRPAGSGPIEGAD
jgi:hypothetical protein